jgi:hypothetical protein
MREEKREVMKRITTLIIHACKEVRFQGVEAVTYYSTSAPPQR